MIAATFAWSFTSSLTLGAMKLQLDLSSRRPWSEGDSHRHGDYLAQELAEGAVARVYAVGGRFVVNLRYSALDDDVEVAKQRIASVKSILLNNVLPAILATNITEAEPLE
ncbi:MAG TPA: hypothetical protein VGG74_12665 [Kofleriaceae bacterium]|jgi:hypothetical protein